jgi:hypothetical protein
MAAKTAGIGVVRATQVIQASGFPSDIGNDLLFLEISI